ncbi:hypothetical protein PMIN04_008145 [Paraphaeosphaeria minitans]
MSGMPCSTKRCPAIVQNDIRKRKGTQPSVPARSREADPSLNARHAYLPEMQKETDLVRPLDAESRRGNARQGKERKIQRKIGYQGSFVREKKVGKKKANAR